MPKNTQNELLSALKKATPVRYFQGKDQLAEKLIKILKGNISRVGVLLLIFEGSLEQFDPLLNYGPVPWAVQVCQPLTPQDMVGFLNVEGISVDDTFLNDKAAMMLLASACKSRPQGVKRLAIALTGSGILSLTSQILLEYLPLLDGSASLRHKAGPSMPSSRTRERRNILRGHTELDF